MPRYKKNYLNPFSSVRYQNNPKAYLNYLLDRVYDTTIESSFVIPDEDKFEAICLSGIRTEDNTALPMIPSDSNDGALSGQFVEITIKPKTPRGDQLPDPTAFTDAAFVNSIIDTANKDTEGHFKAKSDYLVNSVNNVSFGQVVKCYYVSREDPVLIMFENPMGSLPMEPGYAGLMTLEGFQPASMAFQDGLPGLLGEGTSGASQSPAQQAFEAKLGAAIRARGLKFHVTDRSRTVADQVDRVMNKYRGNGPQEVINTYGSRGKKMVAAIEAGDQQKLFNLAKGSSKHLAGNAIDIRSYWYKDAELTIVLQEIRKLGGNPLVEPLTGKCWEKQGRNVTVTKRKAEPGGAKGAPCYNEHIHIDIPEDFK